MKSLVELLNELKLATLESDNQEYINILAIQIVNRLYTANSKKTYDEMLHQYGYKDLKKTKRKIK